MAEPARRRGQRGETLVESIVAIGVLAVVCVAAFAGLSTAIGASVRHDGGARAETLVRSAAEWVQSPDTAYVDLAGCPSAGRYTLPSFGGDHPDLTVSVTSVEFWSNAPTATPGTLPSAVTVAFGTACPATDRGLQRVTLRASGPGTDEVLTVVKRRP